jgi:hypothetical protein
MQNFNNEYSPKTLTLPFNKKSPAVWQGTLHFLTNAWCKISQKSSVKMVNFIFCHAFATISYYNILQEKDFAGFFREKIIL